MKTLTRTVNAVGPLLFRTVSDGSPKANDGWFVLLLACLSDSLVNSFVITLTTDELARLIIDHTSNSHISIVNMKNLPAVREEPLFNIFSKCDGSISVN